MAYRAVLLAAALLVLGLLFHELVTLLLAVLITVIIAIALGEVGTRLERRGVPRGLGVLAALLGGLLVIVTIFAVIIPPFIDETNELVDDVPGIVDDLRDRVEDWTGAEPDEVADRVQEFVDKYAEDPGQLVGPITEIGLSVAGILGALILILITAYYIALRPEPLIQGLVRLFPPTFRPRVVKIMGRLRSAWIGWMQGVVVDMLVSGTLLFIGLTLIGLDFAIFFAVLTALFSVVPYFGAIASGIPTVLFALTDSPGKALAVLALYLVVQQISGNVTVPLVMAKTVKLHPAVIAFGVVVVGQLFGFVGLLVAVPILSMIVILVEEAWIKPMELADAERRREDIELPTEAGLELGDGDDHPRQHEDDDQDLHHDPAARHGAGR